jgi:hypothetical protein
MFPVTQTLFGREEGNCLAACVASILEFDLADVPNFCANQSDGSWLRKLADWLAEEGMCAVHASFVDGDPGVVPAPEDLATMRAWMNLRRIGFAIVNGYTTRGLSHSTVWFEGELVHDPHPSKDPLINVVDMIVIAHRDLRVVMPPLNHGNSGPMAPKQLAAYRSDIDRAQHPDPRMRLFPIYGWTNVDELLADRDHQEHRAVGAERERDSAAAGLAEVRRERDEARAQLARAAALLVQEQQSARAFAQEFGSAKAKLAMAESEVAQLRARVEADDVEREAMARAVEALGSEWSPSPGSEVAVGWSKILRDQLHKAAAMIRCGKAQP